MDGKNSAIRYYKNNFCDGYRQVNDWSRFLGRSQLGPFFLDHGFLGTWSYFQDSMDFFLGNYEWNSLNRSPFQDSIQMKVRVIPIILIVAFSMVIIGTILPPSKFQWHSNFLSHFRKRNYHLEQVAHLGPRWYPWPRLGEIQWFSKILKKSWDSNLQLAETMCYR